MPPMPKRNAERRRRNKDGRADEAPFYGDPVEVPAADDNWHPIARQWFDALAISGQSQFYEPSDWAMAAYVAESMTRNLNAGKFNAQHFSSVLAAMNDLLTSEGSRRRVRLEIDRQTGNLAPVDDLDAYRGLGG